LDVFYDEFIKFIPPYILKREEEKRKRLENNSTKVKGIGGGASMSRVGEGTMSSVTAANAVQKR